MKEPLFKQEFLTCQTALRKMNVAFVEIKNDLEIYTFEAYCALELDTCAWNTFRTH
jgi:hypothetical protein